MFTTNPNDESLSIVRKKNPNNRIKKRLNKSTLIKKGQNESNQNSGKMLKSLRNRSRFVVKIQTDENLKKDLPEMEVCNYVLNEKTRQFGPFKVCNVLGDGNCLFRALSLSLYGSEERHMKLRRKAAIWVRNNRENMACFMSKSDGDSKFL